VGETANGRTGEAHIRAAASMSSRRFLRPGERIGNAVSPPRPFAVSPIRFLAPSFDCRKFNPTKGQSFRNHCRLVWFNETAGKYLPSINGVV
jgi:hypothetical protein